MGLVDHSSDKSTAKGVQQQAVVHAAGDSISTFSKAFLCRTFTPMATDIQVAMNNVTGEVSFGDDAHEGWGRLKRYLTSAGSLTRAMLTRSVMMSYCEGSRFSRDRNLSAGN
jgi:hypothetical protein